MATKGPRDGITKWLLREEWSEAFAAVVGEHIGAVCAAADIESASLPDVLDEDAYEDLMGTIVDDFMTRRIGPDQRNIVTDYLKRRGWKEPSATCRMLEALRDSTIGLYEVSGVVPGKSFLARDMIGGGQVRVSDADVSQDLHQWDRVGMRLIPRNGQTVVGGPVLVFSHEMSDDLAERLKRETERVALRELAPLITEAWLDEQLEEETEPDLADLTTPDGDPMVFHTVRYPLMPGVAADSARARLDSCAALFPNDDGILDWTDGDVLLGGVEVSADAVLLETNSEARARRGQELLTPLLNGLAGEPEVQVPTVEELLESIPEQLAALVGRGEGDETIPMAMLDELYHAVLDQPVPMLDDASPRTAAQSVEGRTKLVAWLKYLENQDAIERAAGGGPGYDFGWMWSELGVADLRV